MFKRILSALIVPLLISGGVILAVQTGGAGQSPDQMPRLTDAEIATVSNPVDGYILYGTDDDIVYVYDGGRAKFLSIENSVLQWGRNMNADNAYLQFGGAMANGGSGVRMPLDGTITRVSIMSSGGNAAKGYDIEIDAVLDTTVTTASNVLTDNTLNIDVDAGERINIFATAAGTGQTNVAFVLWVKWRQ